MSQALTLVGVGSWDRGTPGKSWWGGLGVCRCHSPLVGIGRAPLAAVGSYNLLRKREVICYLFWSFNFFFFCINVIYIQYD